MNTSNLVFFLWQETCVCHLQGGRMLQQSGGASVHLLLFLCLIMSNFHTGQVSHFLFLGAQGMPRSQDRSVFMVSCLFFAHTSEIAE